VTETTAYGTQQISYIPVVELYRTVKNYHTLPSWWNFTKHIISRWNPYGCINVNKIML